ncbi:MAG: bacillithiol system redox-active protein YtxJ [Bacteroidia bacterium]|nr:bacillithiol system redox-active protein YtxJ [Bacteroidia bacterium]
MNWLPLESISQIEEIITQSEHSETHAVLIFKHSTICSISSMALSRLERKWQVSTEKIPTYFLDLRKFRDVSNYLEEKFNVKHESPQVLLIKHGKCVFDTSHNLIAADVIKESAESAHKA